MTEALPNAQDWFGFNSPTYKIDEKNPKTMAFNKDFANDMILRSELSMIGGIAPKFVLMELSGDGKTHAMNYAVDELVKRKLIDKIYFICPNMTTGSKYAVLHDAIITHMDEQDLVIQTLEQIFNDSEFLEPEKKLKNMIEKIKYKEIANATYHYMVDDVSEGEFLQYLKGESIEKSLKAKLKVPGALNVEGMIRVIEIISEFHYRFTKKMIVTIIDESDELKPIKMYVREFKEAFRRLAELPHFGIILIYNIATREDMNFDTLPTGLKDPGVVSRIGSQNYLFKPVPMNPEDVKPLILATNKAMRGENFKTVFKEAKKENQNLDEDSYPFTPDAIDEFVLKVKEYYARKTGEYILPRDVIAFARDCISRAIKQKMKFVDKDLVESREYVQSYNQL